MKKKYVLGILTAVVLMFGITACEKTEEPAPEQSATQEEQKEDQDNPRHGESPAALFPAAGLGRGLSRPAGVAGIRIGRHKGLLSRHRRYEPQ